MNREIEALKADVGRLYSLLRLLEGKLERLDASDSRHEVRLDTIDSHLKQHSQP